MNGYDTTEDDEERIEMHMDALNEIARREDGEDEDDESPIVVEERHTRHFYGARKHLTDEGYAAFRERVEEKHGLDVDELADRGRDYLDSRGYNHLLMEGDR